MWRIVVCVVEGGESLDNVDSGGAVVRPQRLAVSTSTVTDISKICSLGCRDVCSFANYSTLGFVLVVAHAHVCVLVLLERRLAAMAETNKCGDCEDVWVMTINTINNSIVAIVILLVLAVTLNAHHRGIAMYARQRQ